MAKKSYSMGQTPKSVILKALKANGKTYTITAPHGSSDAKLITRIVNMGIDSHLEAVTDSKFGNEKEKVKGLGGRLTCEFSNKDMLVILRRLWEDGSDEAWLLRSDILSTLEIEEI